MHSMKMDVPVEAEQEQVSASKLPSVSLLGKSEEEQIQLFKS